MSLEGDSEQQNVDGVKTFSDNEAAHDHLLPTPSSERKIRLEDVYIMAGGFGKYQRILYVIILVICIHEADITSINFVGGYQDHWCSVQELQNLSHSQQKYISIPQEGTDGDYKTCEVYDLDFAAYNRDDYISWNRSLETTNATTRSCDKWVYDKSIFESTITSRYNLVCGRAWLISMTSTFYICGNLFGGLIGGTVAEKYGRRKAVLVALFGKVIFNILSAVPTNYVVMSFARVMVGATSMVVYIAAFVLIIEFVPGGWRNFVGASAHIAWAFGFMLWPILALAIRHEVTLQLTVFIPRLLFIGLYWVVDESPRWLLLKGRQDEAEDLIRKVASANNKPLPENFNFSSVECENEVGDVNVTKMFRSPRMRRLCLVQSLYWFSTNLIYYALNLNAGSLSGDVFVNTVLLAAMDILGYLVSIFMLAWSVTGRRWTSCLAMLLAGLSSYISVYFILNDIGLAHTLFAVVAKGFVTISFSAIYVYTTELFPSEVRNLAIGTCACIGKISGLVAPFVGGPLGNVWAPLPAIIYGTFGLISGLLILLQPETRNVPLFRSIEEVENYTKVKPRKEIV